MGIESIPYEVRDTRGTTEGHIDDYALVEVRPKIGTIVISDLSPEDRPARGRKVDSLTAERRLTFTFTAKKYVQITNEEGESINLGEDRTFPWKFYVYWYQPDIDSPYLLEAWFSG